MNPGSADTNDTPCAHERTETVNLPNGWEITICIYCGKVRICARHIKIELSSRILQFDKEWGTEFKLEGPHLGQPPKAKEQTKSSGIEEYIVRRRWEQEQAVRKIDDALTELVSALERERKERG